MNHYYYFAATLPPLHSDSAPPFSPEAFLEECRAHLAAGDWLAVKDLLAQPLPGSESGNEFVGQWRQKERQLRNTIVGERAGRLGCDPSESLRSPEAYDSHVEKAVQDAYAKPDPLQRERALDGYRWDLIDEMSASDPFSIRAILAYTLKLQIANRWTKMDEDSGAAAAESLVNRPPCAGEPAEQHDDETRPHHGGGDGETT